MSERVYITSPHVLAYLEKLAALGIYGSKPGAVATWIVRREIMRLVERGVLKPVEFVQVKGGDEDEET